MSVVAASRADLFRLAVSPISQLRVSDPTGSGDGSWVVSGYAATFDDTYTLYDGKWFRMRERVARGAFDEVLQRVSSGDELVHLNHGHDMTSAVAATDVEGIGGLQLRADEHGFRFEARVDAQDPDAVRMAAKMRRGVVAQASFAFTIAEESAVIRELDDGRDDELYTIERIANLYDVCVAAQGANPYTESTLRSFAAASLRVPDLGAPGHSVSTEGHQHHSGESPEGASAVTSEKTGQAATGRTTRVKAQVDATYKTLTRRIA
jgi:HK97 family phage prohead protease